MNLILSIIFSLSIFSSVNSNQNKNFEGYILYENEFIAPDGTSLNEEMKGMFGLKWHYTVDSENYKTIDENGKLMQLYNTQTNTYYFSQGNKVMMIDASFEYPSNPIYSESTITETILDYECKSIIETSSESEITYFFNESIKTIAENYTKHRFGSYGEYLKMSNGALPLKVISKYPEYTMITTAKIVESKKLNKSEFDVSKYQ